MTLENAFRSLIGFASAALATYVALSPATSEAMDRRDSASSCMLPESYYVPNLSGASYPSSTTEGTSWWRTDYDKSISCPYRDDDRFRRDQVNQLNVHVYDGHTSLDIETRACVQYYHTGGGSCGTAATSSGVGDKTLAPGLGAWSAANQSHFGYIYVNLPRKQGAAPSAVRGWWSST